ncbi:MAG: L,D-transpeptidase [Phaeodactylibacter sp.]|nr:L,D-transpeptidase [Phaeodactylibacter sp.]
MDLWRSSFWALAVMLASSCGQRQEPQETAGKQDAAPLPDSTAALLRPDSLPEGPAKALVLERNVKIRDYFAFIDSVVVCEDTLLPYPLTEHLLVRANPWIIDSLANTDYYRMMERDSFVYDQEELTVLRRGDTLLLPGPEEARELLRRMSNTVIDLNIPEFRLRVIEEGDTLFTFPVRVGRNQRKYLALAKATVDLRTMPGDGHIIRIARYPLFLDPSTGRRFTHTRRDDGRTTLMPLIPWIEPEIGGRRYGQLIHPTTNPRTLNKAYSNGCIGVKEADAWYIYYFAPTGTRAHFHYSLQVVGPDGETVMLKDIYGWKGKRFHSQAEAAMLEEALKKTPTGCVCEDNR